jgi:hypothetical protein
MLEKITSKKHDREVFLVMFCFLDFQGIFNTNSFKRYAIIRDGANKDIKISWKVKLYKH